MWGTSHKLLKKLAITKTLSIMKNQELKGAELFNEMEMLLPYLEKELGKTITIGEYFELRYDIQKVIDKFKRNSFIN